MSAYINFPCLLFLHWQVRKVDHRPQWLIIVTKIHDFLFNLGICLNVGWIVNQTKSFILRQQNSSFINNRLILFLQFQKYIVILPGFPVTAHSEFFFINRFFYGAMDQSVVICIIIDIPDHRMSKIIQLHIRFHCLLNRQSLFWRQQVFDFISFNKYHLIFQ